jgi:hypothetical protein
MTNFREIAGFIALSCGLVSLPFCWWFNIKWFAVSVILFIVGTILFLTERNARKLENNPESLPDNLPKNPNIHPTSGDMDGFNPSDD